LAIAILFSVIILVTKTIVPSPMNKMLIGIQALLLALAALLLQKWGATFVSIVSGSLTAIWNIAFAPFTFLFAVLYGLLVDASFSILSVNPVNKTVKTRRLIAAMTLSTLAVGVASYYSTVRLTGVLPESLVLEILIFAMGTINGAVAGYLASIMWNRYLKNLKF
jgi:hypothetical protein